MYQRLYVLPNSFYTEGCPVIIEAGALLKDTNSGKLIAQLKLKNISAQTLTACNISLHAFEPSGKESDVIENFPYLDLDIAPGTSFGTQTPVYLQSTVARRFDPCVTVAVFDGGEIWKPEKAVWRPLPSPVPLSKALNSRELLKQYEIEVGQETVYLPEQRDGLFLCTCGAVNLGSRSACYKCLRQFELLLRELDTRRLQQKANRRLEKERDEQEARVQQQKAAAAIAAARREKRLKIIKKAVLFMISSVAVITAGTLLTKFVIIPNVKYSKAASLLESGCYDEAEQAFLSMDGFRDSEEMAQETKYRKAVFLKENGNTLEAERLFIAMGSYQDAADQLNEMRYQEAITLLGSGNTEDAVILLRKIYEYPPAREKLEEIESDMDYLAAHRQVQLNQLIEQKKFQEAIRYCQERDDDAGVEEIIKAEITWYVKSGSIYQAYQRFCSYDEFSDQLFSEYMDSIGLDGYLRSYRLELEEYAGTYVYKGDVNPAPFPERMELVTDPAAFEIRDELDPSLQFEFRFEQGISVNGFHAGVYEEILHLQKDDRHYTYIKEN